MRRSIGERVFLFSSRGRGAVVPPRFFGFAYSTPSHDVFALVPLNLFLRVWAWCRWGVYRPAKRISRDAVHAELMRRVVRRARELRHMKVRKDGGTEEFMEAMRKLRDAVDRLETMERYNAKEKGGVP